MLPPRVIHVSAWEHGWRAQPRRITPSQTTRFSVAQEPFIEIKLDTDAFHFIQELFRLSEALRESSPLQIDKIWVRVQGLQLHVGRFLNHEPDISDFTRADLETLTRSDHSVWRLLFNTFQHETHWKVRFEVELRMIGGSYPLLIRFLSCPEDLTPFLGDVLERCGSWWDAQVVTLPSRFLGSLFPESRRPFLALSEQPGAPVLRRRTRTLGSERPADSARARRTRQLWRPGEHCRGGNRRNHVC